MAGAKVNKAGTGLFKATVSAGRASVVVDNADSLPAEFKFTSVTITPDKKAIKAALEEGAVPGAHLEDGRPTLRIK
jgi:hypothetical protein